MMTPDRVGITLSDSSWQRHHHAFTLATSLLTLDTTIILFAGGKAVMSLCQNTTTTVDKNLSDQELSKRHIPSLIELRTAFIELGGTLMACETGLKMAALHKHDLLDSVEVCGMVRFLTYLGPHPIITV